MPEISTLGTLIDIRPFDYKEIAIKLIYSESKFKRDRIYFFRIYLFFCSVRIFVIVTVNQAILIGFSSQKFISSVLMYIKSVFG